MATGAVGGKFQPHS